MEAIIYNIIGPYQGPYEVVTTYKLRLGDERLVAWHENGRRKFPDLEIGDIIEGLQLKNHSEHGTIPDYKKSKIHHINKQLNLGL